MEPRDDTTDSEGNDTTPQSSPLADMWRPVFERQFQIIEEKIDHVTAPLEARIAELEEQVNTLRHQAGADKIDTEETKP